MKKHLKFFLKSGLLVIIIFILIFKINRVLTLKYFYNDYSNAGWAETTTSVGFYEMNENSIDILFLGSSNCMTGFSPQYLYDNFGLRSYNLGSGQQSLVMSYYWLQEALRYQTPSVVVLDTRLCFDYLPNLVFNCNEPSLRKAVDYMKWSNVKLEAVRTIAALDEAESFLSYVFPNIRFHSRWTNLNENDFVPFDWNEHMAMKGYVLLNNYCNVGYYKPFEYGSSDEKADIVPLMQEYLDKIISLCKEKGIRIILVKTPNIGYDISMYNTMLTYALSNGIEYYDFNEKSLYEEIGYQFYKDNADYSHVNYWGSQKVSQKMGEILLADNLVKPVFDEQWVDSKEYYEYIVQDAELTHIVDIYEYLKSINRDRYTVFIAVNKEAANALNDNIVILMRELGLNFNLLGKYGNSYYAIISGENIIEDIGNKALTCKGSFREGLCTYFVSSSGLNCGSSCSIKLNNIEYSKNKPGINIVVYDNICKKVIDSICFNTHDINLHAIR